MSGPAHGSGRFSRRAVLGGLGLLGAAGVLGACSDAAPAPPAPTTGSPSGAPPSTGTTAAPNTTWSGDAQLVAVCAAFSSLAAGLYTDAGNAAGQGRVGAVPGAVAAFLSAAAAQHTEHAAAWNALLTAAGAPAVTGTPLTVESERRAALGRAAAPTDLLALAVDVEAMTGGTVTARAAEFTDPGAAALAATLAPVSAMHGATAAFLLGRPTGATPSAAGAPLGVDALTS